MSAYDLAPDRKLVERCCAVSHDLTNVILEGVWLVSCLKFAEAKIPGLCREVRRLVKSVNHHIGA